MHYAVILAQVRVKNLPGLSLSWPGLTWLSSNVLKVFQIFTDGPIKPGHDSESRFSFARALFMHYNAL
jgi:hypothetical protein